MAVMKDVARQAGVSISTVSFVLSGRAREHKVAESTVRRVLQTAKQLGYKPNIPGAAEGRAEPVVAFFIPENAAWLDMEMVYRAIEADIRHSGRAYNVLLCPYPAGGLAAKLDGLGAGGCDAAVVGIESDNELTALEQPPANAQNDGDRPPFPLVIYNHGSTRFSSVTCLADAAVNEAVQIISAKRSAPIAVVTGDASLRTQDPYFSLFVAAAKACGIPLAEKNLIAAETTMRGGAIAARQILNLDPRPELIVCMNSALAFGAIPLLARNGVLIPRDAELLCFGATGESEHIVNYIPSLSMIARPIDEMTAKAFELALQLANVPEAPLQHCTCACRLLLHDSFAL